MKIRSLKVLLVGLLMLGTFQVVTPRAYAGPPEDCVASGGTWTGSSCGACPQDTQPDGNICNVSEEVAQSGSGCQPGSNFLAFPTWYKYLDQKQEPDGRCVPDIPKGSEATQAILPILVAVVEIMLRIVGIAAVGFVIYGSIRYILSQGQPEATKNARQTIINAFIGIAISIVASAAVSFFATQITR